MLCTLRPFNQCILREVSIIKKYLHSRILFLVLFRDFHSPGTLSSDRERKKSQLMIRLSRDKMFCLSGAPFNEKLILQLKSVNEINFTFDHLKQKEQQIIVYFSLESRKFRVGNMVKEQ